MEQALGVATCCGDVYPSGIDDIAVFGLQAAPTRLPYQVLGDVARPSLRYPWEKFARPSADKILHLALQNFSQKAIAGEVTSDDINEHLIRQQVEEDRAQAATPYTEAERALAIQHLMDKHRHSNSPRPSTLKDAA